MVEQMLRLGRLLPEGERLSHIVVMGMGEPLANLDRLLPALGEAEKNDGFGISPRRVTISTVGLPDAMNRLARGPTYYNLAVSLHAADDALRNQLVPTNKTIGLRAVLKAADDYFAASRRRLTFEYVLLDGVNDSKEHAVRLASLLAGRMALLNLIPYNRVAGLPYQTPARETIDPFVAILENRGINIQLRRRKGSRIDAACGQLRRGGQEESTESASLKP
jgi:23S rRNA (adenine2503-C2)-methyltransferase